jgi:hypothetical protein
LQQVFYGKTLKTGRKWSLFFCPLYFTRQVLSIWCGQNFPHFWGLKIKMGKKGCVWVNIYGEPFDLK